VSYAAAIHFSKDGRFLYVSNRGHDSLAVFEADPVSRSLRPVHNVPSGGKWPRDFAIDPAGRFLYAAHQHSDRITCFRISPETGRLTPVSEPESMEAGRIPCPVCLVFANKSVETGHSRG
jgi:6-phosphogluconolactonase